jgi:hypothetical protein
VPFCFSKAQGPVSLTHRLILGSARHPESAGLLAQAMDSGAPGLGNRSTRSARFLTRLGAPTSLASMKETFSRLTKTVVTAMASRCLARCRPPKGPS